MVVILFGPPGSGKGTQAQNLQEKENFLHVSTGNLLRDAIANETEIGLSVKEILASGRLVGNDIVALLLRQVLETAETDRIVLDGFPRTVEQVSILDDILESLGKSVDLVISLEVDNLLLIERMTGRFSCKKCATGYHKLYKPTFESGVCDVCGSTEMFVREDDKLSVVSKRIDVYLQETLPVLSVYRKKGLVKTLDGSQSPSSVFKQICSSLHEVIS